MHDTANATLEGASRSASIASGPAADGQQHAASEDLVKVHLDTHYRRTLDEPIPMLGNRTPRECAADPDGQRDALAWLKTLESTDALMLSRLGSRYDFAWIWTELGLASLR